MTREEAADQIYGLILSAEEEEGPCIFSDQIEALEIAIEALKQPEQQKGEWVKNKSFMYCSICGAGFDAFNRDFLFCPNCGAEMEKEE